MKRIVIIVCYYGRLPEWFNIWVESCKYNSTFDFIIITDNYLCNMPQNIKVINIEFNQLKKIFSEAIGFDVVLNEPYKLCDFKPIYGKAFEQYIEKYDFWGHCDLDLIWGDLKKFITDEMLSKYDLIGMYGHLMIYRNNEKMNNLFKEKGGIFSYKKVYSHNESFGFDEMTGMDRIALANDVSQFKNLKIANMMPNISRFRANGVKATKEFYLWKDGKILRIFLDNDIIKSDEYAYIHFSGKKPKNALLGQTDIKSNIYLEADLIEYRNDTHFSTDELELRNKFISEEQDKTEIKQSKKNKMILFLKKGFYQKIILFKMKIYLRKNKGKIR